METIQQSITPGKAVEILKRNGIAVCAEEAEALLEFLYFLAEIFISDIVEV